MELADTTVVVVGEMDEGEPFCELDGSGYRPSRYGMPRIPLPSNADAALRNRYADITRFSTTFKFCCNNACSVSFFSISWLVNFRWYSNSAVQWT